MTPVLGLNNAVAETIRWAYIPSGPLWVSLARHVFEIPELWTWAT